MAIPDELLAVLACPKCKAAMGYMSEQSELRCESCEVAYELQGDIPILTVDSARAYVRGSLEARRTGSADRSSVREEG